MWGWRSRGHNLCRSRANSRVCLEYQVGTVRYGWEDRLGQIGGLHSSLIEALLGKGGLIKILEDW